MQLKYDKSQKSWVKLWIYETFDDYIYFNLLQFKRNLKYVML